MIKAIFMGDKDGEGLLQNVYTDKAREIISGKAKLIPGYVTKYELETQAGLLADIDVIFSSWGMPALTEEEIAQYFPSLKAIFYGAGSVRHFALPFLKKGISLHSAWAANAVPVAEFTLAQILLSNKGYFQNAAKAKQSYTEARNYSTNFPGNFGASCGILGAGMIGAKVIAFLKNFNIHVMVYDPYISDEKAQSLGVVKASLEDIFTECDVISCHIADLPETKGILDARLFDRMKPYATYINTGRGAQVVEADLAQALRNKPGCSAVLDVTWPEPPSPDNPLLSLPNVFLSTHIAGSMGCEIARMGEYMAEEFLRFVSGEKTIYKVTEEMLAVMA